MVVYSEDNIDRIKSHLKTGYATNYVEPAVYLASTTILFLAIMYAIHSTPYQNTGIIVALVVMLALTLFRTFVIFHDMCHRSYFPTDERKSDYKGFNFKIAQMIEPLCLFSAEYWNNIHSAHHKAHGNLNIHDGTRSVLPSSEFDNLSDLQRQLYKVIRFPPLFFLIAPAYVYWINRVINGEWSWIIKYAGLLFVLHKIGKWKLVGAFVGAQYLAGILGVMIFHVQHQVNPGYWKRFDETDQLEKDNAELNGASVQRIPFWLEYFTNGIEYHNIHHLDPGVPSYNMKRIYYELVDMGEIPDTKLSYMDEFYGLGTTLYDEDTELYN
jgi:omega-6 fatty acid desaturase (delta-12 desaturase)